MIWTRLAEHIRPGCGLVGVGNILCGDDGLGPWVIHQLEGKILLPLLDVGQAPENSTGPLRRLQISKIIIFDALSLEAPVGSLHWIHPDDLESTGMSTHGPSLELFLRYIRQFLKAETYLVGVVPQTIGFGESMSKPVRQAAGKLVSFILEKCAKDDSAIA